MTAPTVAPAAAPGSSPALTPDAGLSPLLRWLVARAEVEPDMFVAAAAASPTALAAGAGDPESLARALAPTEPVTALRLACAALPPREGIWWAWVAVRHAQQTLTARASAPPEAGAKPVHAPNAKAAAALAAVERWIAEPSDANRRLAWDAGQAAELSTPAGCACAAVFFTSGSVAAVQSPMAVPPPAGAHVIMAATAVLLAAVQIEPARLTELVEAAIAQAAAVARRLGGWEPSAELARRHFDAQQQEHGAAIDAATPKTPPA